MVHYVSWPGTAMENDSPRQARMALSRSGTLSTGQQLFSVVGSCLAWSPDGEQLARAAIRKARSVSTMHQPAMSLPIIRTIRRRPTWRERGTHGAWHKAICGGSV